jgi:PTH2 family peptidyl-tRNA hydrolase
MAKQVIVMRTDLRNAEGHKIRTGKYVAQGSHAVLAAILAQMSRNDGKKSATFTLECDYDSPLYEWLNGRFTKICCSVDSQSELVEIYEGAKKAGLICALITDAGLTEFGGVPTLTCCAIGPGKEEDVDKITGHLKLL